MATTTLDIKLNRFDRVYRAGVSTPGAGVAVLTVLQDTVSGKVIVQDPKGFSFKQMSLEMEGAIGLQLSAKSVGSATHPTAHSPN